MMCMQGLLQHTRTWHEQEQEQQEEETSTRQPVAGVLATSYGHVLQQAPKPQQESKSNNRNKNKNNGTRA